MSDAKEGLQNALKQSLVATPFVAECGQASATWTMDQSSRIGIGPNAVLVPDKKA